MENKKFGAFTSSVDNTKFSKTYESILTVIGIVIGGFIFNHYGIDLFTNTQNIKDLAEVLSTVTVSAISAYKSGEALFGFIRKFTVKN